MFGATRSATGSQANEFEFAGEQVDGGTGLQYLRARYLDMETGRFIGREPLVVTPGWTGNPFAYGYANPANLVDPDGLVPVDADGCQFNDYACQTRASRSNCYDGICVGEGGYFEVAPDGSVQVCLRSQWPRRNINDRLCEPYDPVTGAIGDEVPLGSSLIGEYVLDTLYGCKADPALCAAALGAQATTTILSVGLGSIVAVHVSGQAA